MKSSGALDETFARIDAGEPLTGPEGLLKETLKAPLERGMEAEPSAHVGYDRDDPDAARFLNSRSGQFSRTVTSEIGDVDLAVPHDGNGMFTPMRVPQGLHHLDGFDTMINSLCAGMIVRDIAHRLGSTIGTGLSHTAILGDRRCHRR